jgi:hypothetical protein
MTKENIEALDDVLALVHEKLEDGASGDDVRQLADRHLAHRQAILAFVAEWVASEGGDLTDDMPASGQTVSGHAELLERFWAAPRDDASPFGRPPEELKEIASRARIDTAILRKLLKGLVDTTTIPGKLVVLLAEAAGTAEAQVWTHLTSPALASASGTDYFAPSGRKAPGRSTFAEVVRQSSLSAADKDFWLTGLEP